MARPSLSRRVFASFAPTLRVERQLARCVRHHARTASTSRTLGETILSAGAPWRREWNHDWDGRHPVEGKQYQGRVRHLLLVRHGQYDLDDHEHGLTPLGFEQAELTGRRLAAYTEGVKRDLYGEIKIEYSSVVGSTLLRARQTADMVAKALPNVPRLSDDPLLAEGWPVLPMPQGPGFLEEGKVFPATILEDGPRIEAAFRKHVRRDVDHKRCGKQLELDDELNDGFTPESHITDTSEVAATPQMGHDYAVIVCHMNVIRYFVARGLQLPPETWLRMRGNNCGITELIIEPSGQVMLGSFADVGHLSIDQVTFY